MKLLRDGLLLGGICIVGITAFAPPAHAHGGRYVGPGDVVGPPGSGGPGRSRGPSGPTTGGPTGPSTGGPAGPRTPGPSGPTTGGPAGVPTGPGGPSTGPRGIALVDDFTRWIYWWEFNKDPYILLKDAVHTSAPVTGSLEFYLGSGRRADGIDSLKPTRAQIDTQVLPALKRALDDTLERDFDIISSCMIALAKIGRDHNDFKLVEVFRSRLKANNQEIRETAALSLGLAGMTDLAQEQIELLIGLALDNDLGRKASQQSEVNERTRSFAAFGLGLAAHGTAKIEIKRAAFDALKTLLASREASGRNLGVAAIHGISLLNLGSGNRGERDLLDEALDVLENYYRAPLGTGRQMLQAHCPTAIAKLIDGRHERASDFKRLFAEGLGRKLGKTRRSDRDLQRSCALALGQLCTPDDHEYSARLLDSYHNAKDAQTRYFSVLALGQIGGDANRTTLLKLFDRSKSLQKPWCALALGVHAFAAHEAQQTLGLSPEPDAMIGRTLFDALQKTKTPEPRAAIAIALGLARYTAAAPYMRNLMTHTRAQQELAGYLCIGLALMHDTASRDEISRVVHSSARLPDLLKQAAIALGKLGDKNAAHDLGVMLEASDDNLAKLAAISTALGFIGDRSSIKPLTTMLLNRDLGQLPRAFAAVALGGVADKESLPWNSKIGRNTNYRAATETLTNRGTGILDLL